MPALKMLREEKGISQQRLADQIGTSQQNIHRYENGSYEPDILTLKKLANFFDTSIDFLVGNTGIRHKMEPVEKYDLNENEAALVEDYRKLSKKARRSVIGMMEALLESTK